MTGKSFDQIWRERAAANPAKRYGDPEELGAYCAFLCSAQCRLHYRAEPGDRRRKLSGNVLDSRIWEIAMKRL